MSQPSSATRRSSGGEDAVEELADRLAAQEARVVRDDAAERVDELALERVGRDLGEPAALDLAQLGPGLRFGAGATIDAVSSVRGRPLVRARGRARSPRERVCDRRGLRDALLVQRHLARVHGRAVLAEVGHLGVAHEVEAAAHRT